MVVVWGEDGFRPIAAAGGQANVVHPTGFPRLCRVGNCEAFPTVQMSRLLAPAPQPGRHSFMH